MPAKAIEKKPFRYAQLPRELQTTLAAYLDLQTLKNLSCTCKNVRTTLYPVLFKHISAAHLADRSKPDIIYVPPSTQHVQHVSFVFDLVEASSSQAAWARNSINCQLGLLFGLANLRTVRLDFILQRELDVLNLERPVHTFAKAIETIRDTSQQASFTLSIRRDGDISFEATEYIISGLLRPFRNARLDKLVLDVEGSTLETTVGKGEAYQTIMEVAPQLRNLSVTSVPWFGWYENTFNFANLDILDLTYGNLEDVCASTELAMAVLRGISALVRSCGARLSKLILDASWSYDDTDIALARSILSGVPKTVLSEVWLRGSALLYVEDWLQTAQIRELHVDMAVYLCWDALYRILDNHPEALQGLRAIHLYYRQEETWKEDTSGRYSDIRRAIETRSITLHFHVEQFTYCDLHSSREWLHEIKDEVVSLSMLVPDADYDDLCAGDWQPVEMTRLSMLSFDYDEDPSCDDGTAPESKAFGILLARLSAPSLVKLKLSISTPYTMHLHDLIGAIRYSRHPKLNVIEGYLRNSRLPGGWHGAARAQLKKTFLSDCKTRGISVSGLKWQ